MSAITSWLWEFGDGNFSIVQNPTHTYANPGLYTVSLTVSNQHGSDTETKIFYIEVTSPAPIYEIRWFDPPTDTNTPLTPENPIFVEVIFTAPPSPPIFEADFSLFSDGTIMGVPGTDYDPLYSSGIYGVWPANAPLYSGVPWPVDWYGYTLSEFTTPWYVSNGMLYEDGTGNLAGAWLPVYIPYSLLSTKTIRTTLKFVPVLSPTSPPSPNHRVVPRLFIAALRNGNQSQVDLFFTGYNNDPEILLNNGDSYFDYNSNPSDWIIPSGFWSGTEHTIVQEINSYGQVSLTYDSVPYGDQVVPWFPGFAPNQESYICPTLRFLGDNNSINSCGYTYIKVEQI